MIEPIAPGTPMMRGLRVRSGAMTAPPGAEPPANPPVWAAGPASPTRHPLPESIAA